MFADAYISSLGYLWCKVSVLHSPFCIYSQNPLYGQQLNTDAYYSTIMSFYHIRSREQAKYEAVIHRSVLV